MKMLTVHLNTPPKETNLHPPPWKKRKEKKNKQTNKEVEGDSLDGIYLWISLLLLFSSLSASPTSLHLLPIEYKKTFTTGHLMFATQSIKVSWPLLTTTYCSTDVIDSDILTVNQFYVHIQ